MVCGFNQSQNIFLWMRFTTLLEITHLKLEDYISIIVWICEL